MTKLTIAYKFQILPFLFSLFFLVTFIYLGIWQIHRYHYKQNLLSDFQSRLKMQPIALADVPHYADPRFLQLRMQGYYLNDKTMLIQNRFHADQMGYEVLTPFKLSQSNQALLINRGWVSHAQAEQSQLFTPIIGEQMVTGYLQIPAAHQFILGSNVLNPQQQPLIIQKIDFKQIGQITHLDLYPFVVRLNTNQTHGFIRDWQPLNVSPQRSLGYAVQWFAMALALVFAYFGFSCKRRK